MHLFVGLGPVPDPEHQDIRADESVNHPVPAHPELEEAVELTMQCDPAPRVIAKIFLYLLEYPLPVLRDDFLEVASDG